MRNSMWLLWKQRRPIPRRSPPIWRRRKARFASSFGGFEQMNIGILGLGAMGKGLELPITVALRTLFAQAQANGLGDLNITAVRQPYRDL